MASIINRKFFFDYVRAHLFSGSLKQKQVDGLSAILDYWQVNYANKDDRWLAYALGTAHHETDRTFGPIREYGLGNGKPYYPYYGRGLVQLTWDYNYKKMGTILGLNLVANPDLALKLKNAVPIMLIGMDRGIFTGKKLSQYFNPTTDDWYHARRIVNALDKAQLIADYGKGYYAAISYTT